MMNLSFGLVSGGAALLLTVARPAVATEAGSGVGSAAAEPTSPQAAPASAHDDRGGDAQALAWDFRAALGVGNVTHPFQGIFGPLLILGGQVDFAEPAGLGLGLDAVGGIGGSGNEANSLGGGRLMLRYRPGLGSWGFGGGLGVFGHSDKGRVAGGDFVPRSSHQVLLELELVRYLGPLFLAAGFEVGPEYPHFEYEDEFANVTDDPETTWRMSLAVGFHLGGR